jgi:cytoskeletal protein RodZ
LARLIYFISGAVVLFMSLLLINQISPFNLADHTNKKELKTEQIAENEAEDNSIEGENEESNSKDPSGSSTAPTSGSSFKHEVQMDIDGVVEENQDEGWWKID